MSGINYKKILERLISEHPHSIDKIEKVVKDAKDNGEYASIQFSEIVKSKYWTSDEMYELLRFFNYNPFDEKIKEYDYYYNRDEFKSAFYYILKNNLTNAFIACIKAMFNFDNFYASHNITLEEAYKSIVSKIFFDKDIKIDRPKYLTIMLENTPEQLIEKVIQTQFKGYHVSTIENESIFNTIIKSKDINLIKKYLRYVEDINLYLGVAVATGDTKIVELFLDNGADVNYCCRERILGYITPIKMAIRCSDYEMYKFLKAKGASIEEKEEEKYFKSKLLNWEIEIKNLDDDAKDSLKTDTKLINLLEFKRCSSPLEYAITLNDRKSISPTSFFHQYDVGFYDYLLRVNSDDLSEKVINHAKIIDDIFNSIQDKNNIDFTKLIISTFATRNVELFKKYSKYVIENHIEVSCKDIIEKFLVFEMLDTEEIFDSFLEFIEKFDEREELMLYLLQMYYKSLKTANIPIIKLTNFLKKLLDKMPVKNRTKVPLIVYAKDLDTVKALEEYGYTVNNADEEGKNILYYLLRNRSYRDEIIDKEWKLFEYLLQSVTLSHKDNAGKTVLYYIMNWFDTNDEYKYATPEKFGPKNNIEVAATKLIEKMDNESVCNKEISDIIDNRVENYPSYCGGHISIEYVYQHHKDLFDALLKKGFKFSNTFYSILFRDLFPKDGVYNEELKDKINVRETVKYVFESLDRNTEIQSFDISKPFNDIIAYLKDDKATFEEFAKRFICFNNKIMDLTEFYNNNILKRYNPEKYLEYAESEYHTTYRDFNDMLLRIITAVLVRFPTEKIDTILALAPNYDINYQTEGVETSYSYWQYYKDIYRIDYDCDEEELVGEDTNNNRFEADDYRFDCYNNFLLDGGLIQFVIFINRPEALKELIKRGGNLKYIVNEEDHTWDYVNSQEMLSYMESILGKREDSNLGSDEKAYYLNLIGESN